MSGGVLARVLDELATLQPFLHLFSSFSSAFRRALRALFQEPFQAFNNKAFRRSFKVLTKTRENQTEQRVTTILRSPIHLCLQYLLPVFCFLFP